MKCCKKLRPGAGDRKHKALHKTGHRYLLILCILPVWWCVMYGLFTFHHQFGQDYAEKSASVSCGQHRAPTCGKCPYHQHTGDWLGQLWCHGECKWHNDECLSQKVVEKLTFDFTKQVATASGGGIRGAKMTPFNASSKSIKQTNDALVIVLSSAANHERRKIIRDTWWQDLGSKSGWDGVFLIGATNDSMVIKESQYFGDIWFGSEPDRYASPAIFRRLMAAFHKSTLKNYSWVIKTDDDSIVNLQYWNDWTANREPKQVYAGSITWKEPRVMNPNNRHYEAAWPANDYLPYAYGFGYILSHDAVQCFVSHASIPSFRVLNNEDVMMGIMAYLCQVKPTDIPDIQDLSYEKDLSVKAIKGEVHSLTAMQCLWGAIHGNPCQLVSCGFHYAEDCNSCPQGNGATWCNGDCKWWWHVGECVPSMDGITPTKQDYELAASASAFSEPCPFTPPTASSQQNGGWFYDLQLIRTQHVSFDVGFGNALAQYIEEGSVFDIGAGVGQFGIFLKKSSSRDRIQWYGFDGGNNIQDMNGVHAPLMGDEMYVIPTLCWIDASKPVDMEPKDWVISIEVGEHIDEAFEDTFIDNLAKLSKKGVVLSWAVEGQGGHLHINCHNNTHVIQQMASRGMIYDEDLSRKFRESVSELEWLKKTVMVFHHGKHSSIVSCGSHSAPNCLACPRGNGATWCNGECKWCNNKCVHGTEYNGVCSNDLAGFDPEEYSSLVKGPATLSLFSADACRPHIVVSTFKCPECDDLRRTIEDNAKHSFSFMEPDKLAFFVPPLRSLKLNKYGVPVLGSIFDLAIKSCPDARTFSYVNGDMLPKHDFLETIEAVSNITAERDFLIIGRRTDVDWTQQATSARTNDFDFDSHFSRGKLFRPDALDYFVISKNAINWDDDNVVPPFVVGRPGYDNWLVNKIYHDKNVALIDATNTISIIHQLDTYGEFSHGGGMVNSLDDLEFNKRLGKGNWQHGTTNHATFETRWQGEKLIIVDRKRCKEDSGGNKKALDLVQVALESRDPRPPRILCYILTTSKYHDTRAKAVLETWGPKCDRLLFASDQTDESIGAVEIPNTRHDYEGLWQKHRDTLRYIVSQNFTQEYDWFFKCDDDTYVIVENLRSYLMLPEIIAQNRPLQLGHRLSLPRSSDDNRFIPSHLKKQFNFKSPEGKWTYCSGGAGYAMNKKFVQNTVKILDTELCLNGTSATPPEDMAIAFCHVWYGGIPLDTRDGLGRERFHLVSPRDTYNHNNQEKTHWMNQYHEAPLNQLKEGKESISSESVSFHRIGVPLMKDIHNFLYSCRENTFSSNDNHIVNKRYELLVRAREVHAKHGVVNLILLNKGYVAMTLSWVCNVKQIAEEIISKTLFVATDQESYAALKSFSADLNTVLEPFATPPNVSYGQVIYYEYMLFRSRVIMSLLELEDKMTVWITETDAVWFQDPTREVNDTPGDMVVTSDVGKIGSMPEGGFILLRPTAETIMVWKRLIKELDARLQPFAGGDTEDIGDHGSDQLLLEHIMQETLNLNVGWLDPQKFVPGIWYKDEEFRQSHSRPWVIQNNWLVGNEEKIKRAKKWKQWFLSETGDECLPPSDTSVAKYLQ